MARIILHYAHKKYRELVAKNSILKHLFKILLCCLWLFEKFIRFVSRQAYIMTAMMGYSFCRATVAAITLVAANVLHVSTVTVVSRIVMIVGKVFVVFGMGLISFLWLDNSPLFAPDGETPITAKALPVTLTMLFAYAMCSSFFYVYEIAVDSIVLCFCQDMHVNSKPVFNYRLRRVMVGLSPLKMFSGFHGKQVKEKPSVTNDTSSVTGIMGALSATHELNAQMSNPMVASGDAAPAASS